jgi:hypothetical protein
MEFAKTQTKISNELQLYTVVRRVADLSILGFLGSSIMPCNDVKLSNMPNTELFNYFKSISVDETNDVNSYDTNGQTIAKNYFM